MPRRLHPATTLIPPSSRPHPARSYAHPALIPPSSRQVPPSDDGAPQHGFCRRIDAGGAVAVRWPAPLPSAGAKVRLRLSGPAPAPGPLDSLSITASLGSGGEGKGAAVVPLSKVLGAGTEGTADAGSIVGGGGPFDQIEIRRAGDGSQVISICVDVLSVTY